MAVTISAAANDAPAAIYNEVLTVYTWAATAPQTTTYNSNAKRQNITIDRVSAMAQFAGQKLTIERCAQCFSGTV